MADDIKKEVKEVKAFARGIHISPRKARLVVNLIKNMPVLEALIQLDFLTKKAVLPIKKLVNSAVANAKHNFQIEEDKLFVKSFTVDGGRVFFKFQPRAQGRAFPVRKRTSHLNLVLGVNPSPFRVKGRKLAVPPKAKAEKKEKQKPVPVSEKDEKGAPSVEKESILRRIWRRKKGSDTTQVAPKEDVKGKHYTGFDRRGNMGA